MKNFIILLICFFSINWLQAQDKKVTPAKRVLPENVIVSQPVSQNANSENSPYFGFDNKIKSITVNNNIPEKLPTKEGYTDKETYRKAINDWLKAHNVFVKPEFKNTLIEK